MPSLPNTVFIIGGQTIDRAAAHLVIDRLTISLDQPDVLEFTEINALLPGSFTAEQSAQIVIDGTPRFTGVIKASYPKGIGRGHIDVGYRALGLNWLANQIFITASDGSGQIIYNLPTTDQEDYVASMAGRSVGSILLDLFNLHKTQLLAAGILGFSEEDLKALTVVPPEPLILTGRLWNQVIALLTQWHNKYAAWIDGFGFIQIKDQTKWRQTPLRLDADPIVIDQISKDHTECWTQLICRGTDNIQGAYLTQSDKTLIPLWTAKQQAAWSLSDFYEPKGSSDTGSVVNQTSTTLTLQPDDPTQTYDVNQLATLNAEVIAYNPLATDITFSEQRRVTANTALAAGGQYTVTVDTPFNNVGYTRYSIRGQYAAQSLVWRAYGIGPVDSQGNNYVAQHLVRKFSHSQPWSPAVGVVAQTTTPEAVICWSPTGKPPYVEFPATFDIIPYDGVTNGYIVFSEPVVKVFGTPSKLIQGGSAVDGIPSDIIVLVPYSLGPITAQAPQGGGYDGTAYTVDNVQRTLYLEYPQWRDYADTSSYQTLAQEKLDTVKNTVVEGSLTYYGKENDLLVLGQSLVILGNGYTTGLEPFPSPLRTVVLDYDPDGKGPTPWMMRLSFGNRLKPFCGDRLYTHPLYGMLPALLSGGFGSGAATAIGQAAGGLRVAAAELAEQMTVSPGAEASAEDLQQALSLGRSGEAAHWQPHLPRPAELQRDAQHRRRLAHQDEHQHHLDQIQAQRRMKDEDQIIKEELAASDQVEVNEVNELVGGGG